LERNFNQNGIIKSNFIFPMAFRPARYKTAPAGQRMLPPDSSFLPAFCGKETVSFLLFPGQARDLQINK
jgi:hypothetical protein